MQQEHYEDTILPVLTREGYDGVRSRWPREKSGLRIGSQDTAYELGGLSLRCARDTVILPEYTRIFAYQFARGVNFYTMEILQDSQIWLCIC